MATIHTEFLLESLESIFEHDEFYVKLFKDLLYAVTNNDFTNVSRTHNEIKNVYNTIHSQVENFVTTQIYEYIYESTAYDSLLVSLIEIYSVMYTVVYLRKNITDIAIQPDEVVDAYLDMFNFKGKELFNYIQRREICKVIYWYLRRKGTPSLIVKLLDMLGFTYFYIAEFEICESYDNDLEGGIFESTFDKHVYKSRLLYQETPDRSNIGFYDDSTYTHTEVRLEDPLNIKTDEELTNEINMAYPAQSPYYQVGVTVSYTNLEKLISAFSYAMVKKTYLDIEAGEDVYTCKVTGYKGKTSFMGLVLGWSYILGEYFGITETNLYEPVKIKESYDIPIKYDIGRKTSEYGEYDDTYVQYDEIDGGTSNAKDNLDYYDGGNSGIEFTFYDGGTSNINNDDERTHLDGGVSGENKYDWYDGGTSNVDNHDTHIDGGESGKGIDYYDGGYSNSINPQLEVDSGISNIQNNNIDELDSQGAIINLSNNDISFNDELNGGNALILNGTPQNFDTDIDNETAHVTGILQEDYTHDVNGGDANSFKFKDERRDRFYKRNGYTYAKYDYGDVRRKDLVDNGINLNIFETSHANVFDRKDRLYDSNGDIYDSIKAYNDSHNNKITNDLSDNMLYRLKYPVFGWQKDVSKETPLDIMFDIDRELKRLNERLLWQPDKQEIIINDYNKTLYQERDNIKTRKENTLEEIYNIFYGQPIFKTYDNMISEFEKHDQAFKNYIDSIMMSFEERTTRYYRGESYKDEELAENFELVVELLENILESMEYFIFDNTTFMIPVKNLVLSYSKVYDIITKLDKYYTPYHAKLLFPMIVWMIRDLPGDQVAIDDSDFIFNTSYSLRDVLWRADHFNLLDIDPPEPYNPITDWECDNPNMPHIPISNYYLDEPYYNRDELQLNNPILYSVGYDWTKLGTKDNNDETIGFIVRSECLKPINDFDPDIIQSDNHMYLTSGYDICRPDHQQLDLLKKYDEELEKVKFYFKTYVGRVVGDNTTKLFSIMHNLNSEDIFVTVIDEELGMDIKCSVVRNGNNYVRLAFQEKVPMDKAYKVLVTTPYSKTDDDKYPNISNTMFNIYGNGIIKNFFFKHGQNTEHTYYEVYDKDSGELVNCAIRRVNKDISYIYFNIAPDKNHRYRLNEFTIIDKDNNIPLPYQTLYTSFNISSDRLKETKVFEFTHNFHTNNFLTRIYNTDTGEDIETSVVRIDSDNIEVIFNDNISTDYNYKVILMGCMNTIYVNAIPLNNITGYNDTFSGDGKSKSFNINHNLNTLSTVEQIFDSDTGEVIKVLIDRVDEDNTSITFSNAPNTNNDYIVSIYGPMNIYSLAYPSTCFNTKFERFSIKNALDLLLIEIDGGMADDTLFNFEDIFDSGYAESHNIIPIYNGGGADITKADLFETTDYTIKHNMNTEALIMQVYDSHGLKVDTYMKIVDNNTIEVSFQHPIPENEDYYINILSFPDNSIDMNTISPDKYMSASFITLFETNLDINGIYDSYSVKHNLHTNTVIVNVFDLNTNETIESYIAINNEDYITVGFTNPPETTDRYKVVIIGALPLDNLIEDDETLDVDTAHPRPPHFYIDYKIKTTNTLAYHRTYDYDFYDMPDELVSDYEVDGLKYNVHKADMPCMRERVDMIHEVLNGNISDLRTGTEVDGYNRFNILSNTYFWGKECMLDINSNSIN